MTDASLTKRYLDEMVKWKALALQQSDLIGRYRTALDAAKTFVDKVDYTGGDSTVHFEDERMAFMDAYRALPVE